MGRMVAAAEAGSSGLPASVAIPIALVLLALNGFFVAAEIALVSASRARIEELAAAGDRRARLALASMRELSPTLSGAQLGITMVSLGLGAVAEPAVVRLIEPLVDLTRMPSGARHAIAFVIGMAIVVFLHTVVSEMAPKNVALVHPEGVALRTARGFRLFMFVFRPLITGLDATANALLRLVGVTPRADHGLAHTREELLAALSESAAYGTLTQEDAQVLSRVLSLREVDAAAAMTPRVDLHALPDDAAATEILRLAAETGFTRFPVYHGSIDDVVGIVHVKDALVRDDAELAHLPVAELLRPVPAVPETRELDRLLIDMRRDRSQAVIVVDEFGGTAGLLTLEDVLEELVGEIADEFDPHSQEVREIASGVWVVPGTLRRDELEMQTGIRLPESDADTVSGFLSERLGRLVRRGDVVEHDGWRLTVTSVQGKRAGDVEVVAPSDPGDRD